ncbi:protein Diedel-like [Drosophila madeirensis]|uniref:Protein Diedel-like n=1 Tax=Drosophila madeirensis TaxID=30013 RepID=A0AAU9F803_DROMD
MRSAIIGALLFAVCWLACFRGSSAVCCVVTVTLNYRILGQHCGVAGGSRSGSDSCSVTVCGNGEPVVGTYCGRGPCNIFGCNCENGCLSGAWSQSFRERFSEYNIEMIAENWNSGSVGSPTDMIKQIPVPDININIGNHWSFNRFEIHWNRLDTSACVIFGDLRCDRMEKLHNGLVYKRAQFYGMAKSMGDCIRLKNLCDYFQFS